MLPISPGSTPAFHSGSENSGQLSRVLWKIGAIALTVIGTIVSFIFLPWEVGAAGAVLALGLAIWAFTDCKCSNYIPKIHSYPPTRFYQPQIYIQPPRPQYDPIFRVRVREGRDTPTWTLGEERRVPVGNQNSLAIHPVLPPMTVRERAAENARRIPVGDDRSNVPLKREATQPVRVRVGDAQK